MGKSTWQVMSRAMHGSDNDLTFVNADTINTGQPVNYLYTALAVAGMLPGRISNERYRKNVITPI